MSKLFIIFLLCIVGLMGCTSNQDKKIELTCIQKTSNGETSFNLTVIPSSQGKKGRVLIDDRDLDNETGTSKQVIEDIKVNKSVISWIQKFEVFNSDIKSSQSIEISRNTGRLTRTEFLMTPEITTTYSQCEPRKVNKF